MDKITKYINNLVNQVIKESAENKAEQFMAEGEYNEESCNYHMENFGPDDERTIKFCTKKEKEMGEDMDEIGEGNAFTGALAKAKEEGKDEFEVDGKKYQVKESSKKRFRFTESEMIDLIEKIINEQKTAKGFSEYKKAVGKSKKENDEYIKSVTKKMKDYLKDGSNGDFSFDPKIFPSGNGELKKMSKKAYVPSEAVEEYIENFAQSAGMENLHYDEIKPNEEWLESNIEGSSKTGNNPKWANAVETPNNKNVNQKRKKNLYNIAKQQSYKRVPSPVTDVAGDSTQKGKMNVDKLLNQLESTTEQANVLNEEFSKINNLIKYNRKTQ